jgi:GT2 family glycosyltransferase
MSYPWFEPRKHEIGGITDYSMEDVSFCLRAKEKGFKVCVDPKVIVGHEKQVVL